MSEPKNHRNQAWRLTLLAGLLAAQFAVAQPTTPVAIDIPAQPLAEALARFAEQSGLKTLYAAELLAGKTAPRVQGQLSPAAALQQLLAGTGLRYRAVGADAIAIEAIPAGEEAATRLRPVTVSADGVNAAQGSYAVPVASTGTKTDTPLIDTPVSVQVVTRAAIEDQKAVSLSEALANVSGIVSRGNSVTNGDMIFVATEELKLRGFTNGHNNNNLLVNGVSIQDTRGTLSMVNVESIEVLKGPAAILYGRMEPGGVVNVITKRPQADRYNAVEVQLGSWGSRALALDTTGAADANRQLLYRLNLGESRTGSWREGDIYSRDTLVAPSLAWKPSSGTALTLDLSHARSRSSPDAVQFVPFVNGQPDTQAIPWERNLGEPSPSRTETNSIRLGWEQQLGDLWTLKVATSHARNHWVADVTQVDFYDAATSVLSRAEFLRDVTTRTNTTSADLVGRFDALGLKHTVLIGADHRSLQRDAQSPAGFACNGTDIDIRNPVHPGTPNGFYPTGAACVLANSTRIDNHETGFYVQDQFELPGDVLLTLGARRQHHNARFSLNGATPSDRDEDHTTPRFGALWRAAQGVSLYASYTEGFGESSGTLYPGDPAPPTNARQTEVGVKFESADGRRRGSVAWFDLTKTNITRSDTDPAHPCPPCYVVIDGELRSKGIELDLMGEIMPGWDGVFNYAHTDARWGNNSRAYRIGTRFSDVPQDMASLWSTWALPGDLQGWKLGGGLKWRSKTYDDLLAAGSPQPSYTPGFSVLNFMTSYRFKAAGSAWTAQLNIDNLFNKRYWTYASPAYGASFGNPELGLISYGDPRRFRASIKVEF